MLKVIGFCCVNRNVRGPGTGAIGSNPASAVWRGIKWIGADLPCNAGTLVRAMERCSPSEPQRETIIHSYHGCRFAVVTLARMATTNPLRGAAGKGSCGLNVIS